jgi:hypothetical protein
MNQPQTPDNEVITPRTDEAAEAMGLKAFVVPIEICRQLERELSEKTNEVARLRELFDRAILSLREYNMAEALELEARLAPAPEETQDGATMDEWYGGFSKIESTEPVIQDSRTTEPEWRELGPHEVIQEGDECEARYFACRPLPKQEEMPLEDDDQIERLFEDEIDLIEKWGCSQDPIRSVHAQEAFVHVIHALRCLDNEIQQHEDMFTTWIKATEDQRREIRYLRDEIQKLKQK